MAKVIKCPTCATQIEVPPQASGQIVKCPGCGKGLKLVAKKQPQQPSAGGGAALSASGSPINKESSVAGGSVSAMSFHDEPPPQDPPSLDSCAVCGRPTDFADLVEDNGKLVCADCIKGARSFLARPEGGVDAVDFKAPAYRPVPRGRLVNITPAFLAACALGMIWVGCQLYLSMTPKPVGKGVAIAKPTKTGPAVPSIAKPENPPEGVTTAPIVETPTTQPEVAVTPPEPVAPAPTTTVAVGPTPAIAEPDKKGSELFPPEPTEPVKPVAPAPPPPELATANPIDRGMERLQAGDYAGAKTAFDQARIEYIVKGRLAPNAPLTPQQAQSLNGLAAAYLGQGKIEEAKASLNVLTEHKDSSRALAINRSLTILMSPRASPKEYIVAVPALKQYLDSAPPDDEYAVDVFGSLLGKLSAMPNVKRTEMEGLWTAWDGYVDRMGPKHEGQLKWGVTWLPADEVKALRASRSVVSGITPEQAGKNLTLAQAKEKAAQTALDKALANQAAGRVADVADATQKFEAAKKALEAAEKDFAGVAASKKQPKWLTAYQPVLP